jgi:large subunit ribosomal protein L29
MDYAEIKKLTDKELHTNLKDERMQLKKLRFNHAVSSIENPNKIREAKKLIARLLTEINSRRNQQEAAQ